MHLIYIFFFLMKNLTLRTTESAGKREIRYFKKRRINSIAQNPKLIMPRSNIVLRKRSRNKSGF